MIEKVESDYWKGENYTERIESSYFYDYVYGHKLIFDDKCMKNFKEATIVLDAGCGFGRFLSFLENLDKDKICIGFDFSKRQVRMSKKITKKAMLLVADLRNLPFKQGAFDMIFMIHALHHTLDHSLIASELMRVIKTNRYLYSIDPNSLSPFSFGDKLLTAYIAPLEKNIDPFYYEKLFEKAGFETKLKFERFVSPVILHFLMLINNESLLKSEFVLKFILLFDKLFKFPPVNYLSFNLCLTALKR
jgi:SAM-dependent methyltransferase